MTKALAATVRRTTEQMRGRTLDAAIKTEVSEIPTSANPDNDDEWEDEDKTREFAKKRARGHRSGQKHSSKRKDMEQDLVSTHLRSAGATCHSLIRLGAAKAMAPMS